MLDQNLGQFTDALASSSPVPGGGGASALAAALGVALGEMVGSLTVGKKKYQAVEEQIKELMQKAENLRGRILACIQQDAQAFEPLSRAYGIPRDNPDRDKVMESCLKTAAEVPMQILELCCEAVVLMEGFADKGSQIMLSDAATGAALLRGAMQGAAMNVKVNTRLMKDRAYANKINACVDSKMQEYLLRAEQVFQTVYGRYC